MRVKYSLHIDGVDYSDKLIHVSDISVGVKKLGIGFISDITVQLVYSQEVLSKKGSEAVVGLLVGDKSFAYKGVIRNVSVKDHIIELNISHELSVKEFKGLGRYYSSALKKSFIVPVLYGNGQLFKATGVSISGPDASLPPNYKCLIGDKPVNITNEKLQSGVYAVLVPKSASVGTKYFTFPDGNIGVDIWNTSSEKMKIKIKYSCKSIYGIKSNSDGSESEIYLGDSTVWINSGDYEKLKFVTITGCIATQSVYQPEFYYNEPVSELFSFEEEFDVSVNDIDNPADITVDILQKSGFSIRKKSYSRDIKLNFQSKESYKTILQRVAEQGVFYVIPTLDSRFDILDTQGTVVKNLSEADFLEGSFSISIEESTFSRLRVLWNREIYTSVYGSGKEKEYKADYIVDQTSVNNFANAYIDYHNKLFYVEFELPIHTDYVSIEVGDILSITHNKYGILNKNFQIIYKSIREDRIKLKCKEI